MRRLNTMSRFIFVLLLAMTVQLNVSAQDDEESADRENSVWSDVIPEQEIEVSTDELESGDSASEDEDDQGSFIPTEKIYVDSAISFPVDI